MRPARRENGSDCSQTCLDRSAWPGTRLAAEQHALDAGNTAHVHVHRRVIRHHAAGIHVQAFTGSQLALDHAAAGVMNTQPSPSSFMMKPSPPNRPVMILRWNCADLHAARAGQEAVLLADQAYAVLVSFIASTVPG